MPPNFLSACSRDTLRCHVCMYVFYSVTLRRTLKHETILIVQHDQSLVTSVTSHTVQLNVWPIFCINNPAVTVRYCSWLMFVTYTLRTLRNSNTAVIRRSAYMLWSNRVSVILHAYTETPRMRGESLALYNG